MFRKYNYCNKRKIRNKSGYFKILLSVRLTYLLASFQFVTVEVFHGEGPHAGGSQCVRARAGERVLAPVERAVVVLAGRDTRLEREAVRLHYHARKICKNSVEHVNRTSWLV